MFEDINCPACGYKPPTHFNVPGQHKALEKHIGEKISSQDPQHLQYMEVIVAQNQPPKQDQATTNGTVKSEEPKERVTVQQRPTAPTKPNILPISPDVPNDPKKERINRRTEEWGNYLYRDFNPLLVTTTKQLIGVPEQWAKGGPGPQGEPITIPTPDGKIVTFWNPSLNEQLELSESECKRIAKAGATFAESPMGQAITLWLEANAGLLALGSALAVAGAYGWKVMRIKTEITQLKQVIEEQQKIMQPQPAQGEAA